MLCTENTEAIHTCLWHAVPLPVQALLEQTSETRDCLVCSEHLVLEICKQGTERFWMTLPKCLHKRKPLELLLTISFGVYDNMGRCLETSLKTHTIISCYVCPVSYNLKCKSMQFIYSTINKLLSSRVCTTLALTSLPFSFSWSLYCTHLDNPE